MGPQKGEGGCQVWVQALPKSQPGPYLRELAMTCSVRKYAKTTNGALEREDTGPEQFVMPFLFPGVVL